MIIKLNNKICKDEDEAIDLIKEGKDFDLSIVLDNGDTYRVDYHSGSVYWFKNRRFHREDGPALEFANGGKRWYKNGKPHREDGPAVEYSCGDKVWYLNGKLHRDDGPAIEYTNDEKHWYLNGKCLMSLKRK